MSVTPYYGSQGRGELRSKISHFNKLSGDVTNWLADASFKILLKSIVQRRRQSLYLVSILTNALGNYGCITLILVMNN